MTRVLLRDLSPGQQYAISFRSVDGVGNTSDWSQVQRFTTTADTMPPNNVANLTWYNSGTSFIAQWDKVLTNFDGSPIRDLRDYHVVVTNGSIASDFYTTDTKFEFTNGQNIAQFTNLQTALTVKVTARDMTYNESKTPAVATVNPANPPVPSKPGLSTYMGLLMVTWDSKTSTGADMTTAAKNFNYCEVHVSKSDGFTPDNTTFAGRIFADSSASKFTVPGLDFGVTYYVRLVAVNILGKHSGPSEENSGQAAGISGLDIKNGQIAAEQLNWTSQNIPGGNAYYSTSQPNPTDAVGGAFKVGDIWYDTDDNYTTYRYDGTTWQPAPDIGFIPGSKIIAGTITANAIATNMFDAYLARIGTAFIDKAMIQSINAGQIETGRLDADTIIQVGPDEELHTEIRNTGIYVMTPIGGQPDPNDPTGMTIIPGTATMVSQIKMGAGTDGDAFAVLDPQEPDSTLANVDTSGGGSFQNLSVENDPLFQGQPLSQKIDRRTQLVGEGYIGPIKGLNFADPSGTFTGIRSEYGLGQFSFPVRSGRTYRIDARLDPWYATALCEAFPALRLQKDQRSAQDIQNGVAPTAVTLSSPAIYGRYVNSMRAGAWQNPTETAYWRSDFDGIVTVGFSMRVTAADDATGVIKVPDGATITFKAWDCGASILQTGQPNTYGGNVYTYTIPSPPAPPPAYIPPPTPPPALQNYTWGGGFDWVRSYKSNGAFMTNTNGRAYQGLDPSGYNGNQRAHFGFSYVDFAGLLAGASNIRITLYLYYAHWYYNSGGTAVIGYHNQRFDPGTAGFSGGTYNLTQRGGVSKPGSFSMDISGFAGAMQNGSFRGIALGPGPSNSETYYGYATDCRIDISYTK